jgi:hypothetical protein
MFKIEPAAENLETAVLRPSRLISVPTIELVDENLLVQFLQNFRNLSRRQLKFSRISENQVFVWTGLVCPVERGTSVPQHLVCVNSVLVRNGRDSRESWQFHSKELLHL